MNGMSALHNDATTAATASAIVVHTTRAVVGTGCSGRATWWLARTTSLLLLHGLSARLAKNTEQSD